MTLFNGGVLPRGLLPVLLKLGIHIVILDFKRYCLRDNFHNLILVFTGYDEMCKLFSGEFQS
jgi:hypothetical protein